MSKRKAPKPEVPAVKPATSGDVLVMSRIAASALELSSVMFMALHHHEKICVALGAKRIAETEATVRALGNLATAYADGFRREVIRADAEAAKARAEVKE